MTGSSSAAVRERSAPMPNYHCSVKVISRATGRSAVACAAYRSNERLRDERLERDYDYTARDVVRHEQVMLPDGAPDEFRERERLWNAVEAAERRKDSQLAREVEVSLPRELSREEQVKLVRDYAQRNFVDEGMCADVCVHDRDGRNPHAHIMLTMRRVDADGFGKKERSWNDKARVQEWRRDWERTQNRALERFYERTQTPERDRAYVDSRSYAERGVERLPQRHEGPQVREIEAKAEKRAREQGRKYEPVTEARRENIEIQQQNALIERINRAIERCRERAQELRQQAERRIEQTQDRLADVRERLEKFCEERGLDISYSPRDFRRKWCDDSVQRTGHKDERSEEQERDRSQERQYRTLDLNTIDQHVQDAVDEQEQRHERDYDYDYEYDRGLEIRR